MKYFLLIPAIILDVTQFMLGWIFIGLQFATPVGVGFTGALGYAAYCWSTSSGIISGIFNAASCFASGGLVGAGLSAFATPIGVAINVALSVTVGAGILLMLGLNGAFYPRIVFPRMLGEVMPFFNFLPVWTNMVWSCLREQKKEAKQKGGLRHALSFVSGTNSPSGGNILRGGSALTQQRFSSPQDSPVQQSSSRVPLVTRQFKDIRTAPIANDNVPKKSYAA